MKLLRRDLKVCEGCGGLWVRTGVEAGVYCRYCSPVIAALPSRRRRSPGRPCRSVASSGRADQREAPELRLHLVHARCQAQSSERNLHVPAVAPAAHAAGDAVNQSPIALGKFAAAGRLTVVTNLAVLRNSTLSSNTAGGAQ